MASHSTQRIQRNINSELKMQKTVIFCTRSIAANSFAPGCRDFAHQHFGKAEGMLACIAHKSLEICERCRLWQQNSPAAPKILLLFGEKSFNRQELKHSRTQELKKNQKSRAEVRIAAFLHS